MGEKYISSIIVLIVSFCSFSQGLEFEDNRLQIHLVGLFDTNDPIIGSTAKVDQENILQTFRCINTLGITPINSRMNEHIYSGDEFLQGNLIKALSTVKSDAIGMEYECSNQVLFVFISSHGKRDSIDEEDKFQRVSFLDATVKLELIKNEIRKIPGLDFAVIIANSCNTIAKNVEQELGSLMIEDSVSLVEGVYVSTGLMELSECSKSKWTDGIAGRALNLMTNSNSQKIITISASAQGGYSYSDEVNGGHLIRALIDVEQDVIDNGNFTSKQDGKVFSEFDFNANAFLSTLKTVEGEVLKRGFGQKIIFESDTLYPILKRKYLIAPCIISVHEQVENSEYCVPIKMIEEHPCLVIKILNISSIKKQVLQEQIFDKFLYLSNEDRDEMITFFENY